MSLKEFTELEAKLGHAPTEQEVREAKKTRLKKANVSFADPKYNYSTSVNGEVSDEQIIKYFKGQMFNLGNVQDNVQQCTDCTVEPSNL
jgi:hypothetical protein